MFLFHGVLFLPELEMLVMTKYWYKQQNGTIKLCTVTVHMYNDGTLNYVQ